MLSIQMISNHIFATTRSFKPSTVPGPKLFFQSNYSCRRKEGGKRIGQMHARALYSLLSFEGELYTGDR
jgi:hypothetical protein